MTDALLAALVPLSHLTLVSLIGIESGVSLEPLQRMPALRSVGLYWEPGPGLSDVQAADLRDVPQLEGLCLPALDVADSAALERLVDAHALSSLRSLTGEDDAFPLTAGVAALLPRLPSLTVISVRVLDASPLVCFRQLPQLRALNLRVETPDVHVPRLLAEHVRFCRELEVLNITWDLLPEARGLALNSALLGHCLAGMTQLHTMRLTSVCLGSLAFLAQGSLPRTLRDLVVWEAIPRLLSSELVHVHALQALQSLRLDLVFAEPLPVEAVVQLTPPSLLLPALTSCDVSGAFAPARDADEAVELGMPLPAPL